jgi:HKD family nuclease
MKITFLGQGYEPESKNSVGNHLVSLLSQKEFHSFTGISGFASEAGILGLANHILNAKKYFKKLNLIVGVDQGKTSKEALREINNLNINAYIFHQREPAIFHPKIYLFEGHRKTKLILGSSNMTARGLFGNVESSLLLEFLNKDIAGKYLLRQLKDYYSGLFAFTDPNLFKISEKAIQDFIDNGIVPVETVMPRKYGKRQTVKKEKSRKSNLKIPPRASPKIPNSFKSKPITSKEVEKIMDELEIAPKV